MRAPFFAVALLLGCEAAAPPPDSFLIEGAAHSVLLDAGDVPSLIEGRIDVDGGSVDAWLHHDAGTWYGGAQASFTAACAPAAVTRNTSPIAAPAFPEDDGGWVYALALHQRLFVDLTHALTQSGALCRDFDLPVERLHRTGLVGLMLPELPSLDVEFVHVSLQPTQAPSLHVGGVVALEAPYELHVTAGTATLVLASFRLKHTLRFDVHQGSHLALTVVQQQLLDVNVDAASAWTSAQLTSVLPEWLALIEPAAALTHASLPLSTLLGAQPGQVWLEILPGQGDAGFVTLRADLLEDAGISEPPDIDVRVATTYLPQPTSFAAGPVREYVQLVVATETVSDAGAVEHQLRVDDGPWLEWQPGFERVITDRALMLQGRHRVEVLARLPNGYVSELTVLPVVVDVEPPVLSIEREPALLRVDVSDRVDEPEDIAVEYRLNGGDWSGLDGGEQRTAPLPDGVTRIEVTAADLSGRVAIASWSAPAPDSGTPPPPDAGTPDAGTGEPDPEPEGCGCSGTALFWPALLVLAARRRAPNQRHAV